MIGIALNDFMFVLHNGDSLPDHRGAAKGWHASGRDDIIARLDLGLCCYAITALTNLNFK
jgi:hypothetical protein